ncbi:MAG: hypothetical protein ACTSR8_10290 [Promethearchaeota archaeon]
MEKKKLTGILIIKRIGNGSRSDAPQYLIQPLDNNKNLCGKKIRTFID